MPYSHIYYTIVYILQRYLKNQAVEMCLEAHFCHGIKKIKVNTT